jgi:hypothetical protein
MRLQMTQSSITDGAESAIEEYRKVCAEFLELARSPKGGVLPIRGGQWNLMKYMLRHPIKVQVSSLESLRAMTRMGTLTLYLPLEPMVASLIRYSEPQLRAIKGISEIQLRRAQFMITSDPFFKLVLASGPIYAFFQFVRSFVPGYSAYPEFLKNLFESSKVQEFIVQQVILPSLIAFLVIVVYYIFFFAPMIFRVQLVDDILQIAIEEKRFASSSASNPGS